MEYMEVLNQIVEAERVAQRIAGEAKTLRDNLPNDLRARWEEIRAEHMTRAEQRVKMVREQEESIAAQQIGQLDTELRDSVLKLTAYFEEHHDQMADELFRLVIGV